MTDIRLSLIKGIDKGAIFHINNLIMAYIQQNGNVGSIEITRDSIVFSKFLFKKGEIGFYENQLECRNGIIYYTGQIQPNSIFKEQRSILLINILHQIKSGYVYKF